MSQPLILLISGWSHAGKDSIAKLLVESYDFQKFAFADPIKHQVAKELSIPLESCYDQKKKSDVVSLDPGKRTLREILIHTAESARDEDPEIWGRVIGEKIQKSASRGKRKFVISDWRFLEELWAVQKANPGACIVPLHVQRPSQLISPVPDATEYSLLGFPFWRVIQNSGTIVKLIAQVTTLIEEEVPKIWKSE
jgi:hypothetical protein